MAADKTETPKEPEAAPAKDAKAPKKPKAAKEEKAPKTPQVKKGDYGPDFQYIIRLASTDLDGTKAVGVALTAIKGVGARMGRFVAQKAGVTSTELIGNLKDEQVQALQQALEGLADTLPHWAVNRPHDYDTGDDLHLVGPEVGVRLRDDLNRLKKIRSYRGIRHEAGLPVRGQRTRSNGRTGLTIGVQRTRAADAPAKKEGE